MYVANHRKKGCLKAAKIGLKQNWLWLAGFTSALALISIFKALEAKEISLDNSVPGSWLEYLTVIFAGSPIRHGNEQIDFPVLWLVVFFLWQLMVLVFPARTPSVFDSQILIRIGRSTSNWVRLVELFITFCWTWIVILLIAIWFGSKDMTLIHPGFIEETIGLSSEGLKSGDLLAAFAIVPLMMLVIGAAQIWISQLLGPSGGFVAAVIAVTLSVFIPSPVRFADSAMLYRSRFFDDSGVQALPASLICVSLIVVFTAASFVVGSRKDILVRKDVPENN